MEMTVQEWAEKHRFKAGEAPQYLKDIKADLEDEDIVAVRLMCSAAYEPFERTIRRLAMLEAAKDGG